MAATDALTNVNDLISGGGATTNAAATNTGSITLLFRALDGLTTGGQRFLLGQGNTTTNGNALGVFFENGTSSSDQCALKIRIGDGTTAILSSNNIVFGGWYYLALTYDEARDAGEMNWYLGRVGGALNSGTIDIGNDAVVGENGPLIVGNQTNLNSAFRNPGKGRIDEFAVWSRELSGAEITNQFTRLPNPFPANASYQEVVTAQRPAYYFKLDNSFTDSVSGSFTLNTNGDSGAFTADILGNAGRAYSLNQTNDALYTTKDIVNGGGPGLNTTANGVGSITFLFRMLSDSNNTGQRHLFAQGGTSPTRNQLALFLENTNFNNGDPNSLKLRVGNGPTTTIIQQANLIPNAWYYFAMTYDESRNSNPGEVKWYVGPVGSALITGAIDLGNDAVVGDNLIFALGNRESLTNNAFRSPGTGVIDEFAIWNDELAADEIVAQFNSVLNVSGPPPSLAIALSGADVLLSWLTNSSAAFHLESTATLTPPAWTTNTSMVTVIGGNYVVTNAVSAGQQYFRLKMP